MVDDRVCANAIRFLSIDAVQQANSGHPGMPMGMADIATVLWRQFLRVNPRNPNWFNRDRFVLSNGHGSMLQYALLHLSGFEVSIEDLKAFRQLHSKTPGHPEYAHTPGVETTTGPLGQGLANAVGMALAEKKLAAEFNQSDATLVDHFTYAFAGDGCLMEGISHEVCSLAGTWGLGKLIVFYDDNNISIDGQVQDWFTDNTPQRFAAYGWQVIEAVDGHDYAAITAAIEAAQQCPDQPTLICCKTQIGFGSPQKANTAAAHGAPLGEEEIAATRAALDWSYAPFEIADEIYQAWDLTAPGQQQENEWNVRFAAYEQQHPQLAAEFLRRMQGYLPDTFAADTEQFIQTINAQQQAMATRKSSLTCLNEWATLLPELCGGSADLTGSNCTLWQDGTMYSRDNPTGRYLYYGVREFGMAAIANGLALHGGYLPYVATFLVFSDYARNAIRLSAMMKQKVVYVFTHDSIGLGEDGPTHQPIEHLTMLRATPGLETWRPADTVETAVAWQQALQYQGASALLLSRQTLPAYGRSQEQLGQIAQGGYVLSVESGECQGVIIATGSEVELAMSAQAQLQQQGINVRVVSMPCLKRFLSQSESYQQQVLPRELSARVVVEAGHSLSWGRIAGIAGVIIGIDHFGYSAPIKDVYQECGLTVPAVVQAMVTLQAKLTV
jgi:transketolase